MPVNALTDLVAEEVRAGHTSSLTDRSDEIAELAVRLLSDDETAERAVRRWARQGSLAGSGGESAVA
jgi:hypothetical protein